MKKFLALLFVCAGLTAMAMPHVNKSDLATAKKGEMVIKTNTLANNLTAGLSKNFMTAAKKNVQMNHAANLVNKRAPRRLSNEEIITMPYVSFLYAYDVNEDGSVVESDPFYVGQEGAWYPDVSDGLYVAPLYWDASGSCRYLPIEIDYSTGEVALPWGILLSNDSVIGTARNRTDTIRFELVASEAFMFDDEEKDCMGTLYEDGSIIFEDNYCYFSEVVLRNYKNRVLESTDTIRVINMYKGTELMVANGQIAYTNERDNTAGSNYVYMFQNEAADSLYIGNLWGYGVPSVAMTISPEAKMNYNCVMEEDGQSYLYNPIWDISLNMVSGGLGAFYGIGAVIEGNDGVEVQWGFEGDVTSQEITWDYASMCNNYHILYGWLNNRLTWLNGNEFRIPGGNPILRGDVDNDGEVAIADVTTLIDHLLKGDFDDAEDFSSDAADCDLDGEIAIADVTTLIDYLLRNTWPAE